MVSPGFANFVGNPGHWQHLLDIGARRVQCSALTGVARRMPDDIADPEKAEDRRRELAIALERPPGRVRARVSIAISELITGRFGEILELNSGLREVLAA